MVERKVDVADVAANTMSTGKQKKSFGGGGEVEELLSSSSEICYAGWSNDRREVAMFTPRGTCSRR